MASKSESVSSPVVKEPIVVAQPSVEVPPLEPLTASAFKDDPNFMRIAAAFLFGARAEMLGFYLHRTLLLPIQTARVNQDVQLFLDAVRNYLEHVYRFDVMRLPDRSTTHQLVLELEKLVSVHGLKDMAQYLLDCHRNA